MFGIKFWPACRRHDYHYSSESPIRWRIVADIIFYFELLILVLEQANGIWHGVKGFVAATVYFGFVVIYSGSFFSLPEENK